MYEVTVTVSDGVARSSQAVLVTVTNKEEDGKITLTQRRPQEGIAITANLGDPDGNITDTKWQWYRGNAPIGIFTTFEYCRRRRQYSRADGDVKSQ